MPQNKPNPSLLLSLALTFLKIGAFTFGGGYAMVYMMEYECALKRNWITHDELMDMAAIAESTPGPISVNCATFIGYRQAGLSGAILATVSTVLPSFVTIFLISLFLENILEITVVANAFNGIKIAVGVLILNVAVKIFRQMKKTPLTLTIALCSLAAMLFVDFLNLNFSSIYIILLSGFVGYVALLLGNVKAKADKGDGG